MKSQENKIFQLRAMTDLMLVCYKKLSLNWILNIGNKKLKIN